MKMYIRLLRAMPVAYIQPWLWPLQAHRHIQAEGGGWQWGRTPSAGLQQDDYDYEWLS